MIRERWGNGVQRVEGGGLAPEDGVHPVGDSGRGWGESRGAAGSGRSAARAGSGRESEGVRDLSTRNHLRGAPERRALSPHRSPAAPGHWQVRGHRLRRGAGRTHGGLGTNEPGPPRPPPPAAVAAASAKPSFGHHAAASQHVGRGRCQNPGGRLQATRGRARHKGEGTGAPPWPFSPNADPGGRNRGNGGPLRSQRRFAGSFSRHPLRCRKPVLQGPALPDQVPEVTAPLPHPRLHAHPRGPHFLPPRSRHALGSRAFPGAVAGRAGARLAVPAPRARACWRRPRGTAPGGPDLPATHVPGQRGAGFR